MRLRHFASVGAIAGLAAFAPVGASAQPQMPAAPSVGAGAGIIQVQHYRGWPRHERHGYYGHRHRGGWGRGIGPFLGGLAAGAIIGGATSGYAGGTSGTNDAYARCSAQFRSFDPQSGTYTTYGGEQRVCPYLR